MIHPFFSVALSKIVLVSRLARAVGFISENGSEIQVSFAGEEK
jgi:hypothetical protein